MMRKDRAKRHAEWGLDELLDRFDLSIQPAQLGELVVAGTLAFQSHNPSCGSIEDAFEIEIRVPTDFPRSVPRVRETGARIDRSFHHFQDGSLCLGSPLRLQLTVSRHRTLTGFVEKCVVPYLVGFIVHKKTGGMPFGELEHGGPGLVHDYREILGMPTGAACLECLRLLSLKKRVANKRVCPCGKARLGRCHNRRLNRLRQLASRATFAGLAHELKVLLANS
jgi:hypothetical protein